MRVRGIVVGAVAYLFFSLCAIAANSQPHSERDGPPYEILQIADTLVRDGSVVLMVTYRASEMRSYDEVKQAGIELLPTFVARLAAGRYDALAIRAQHRTVEVGGAYTANNFTVVFQREDASGGWVAVAPKE